MELSRTLRHFNNFRHFWRAGLDLLFPPRCLGCNTREGPFANPNCCHDCWGRIDQLQIHPQSQPQGFSIITSGAYTGHLRDWITRAKFENDTVALSVLQKLSEQALARGYLKEIDLVTYVPSTPSHARKRGVHLPASVARHLARRLRKPLIRILLARTRPVPGLTGRTREERRRLVEGAFRGASDAEGRSILIVDDVYTTGATLGAAANALQEAGASRVLGFALAHTPLENAG